MYDLIFLSVILYAFIGFMLVAPGYVFDVTSFTKKVNPAQDVIGWLPFFVLLVLWLPLLIIWHASSMLRPKKWHGYVRYADRMAVLVERMRADDDDDLYWDSYITPSPGKFKKNGLGSFK